MTTVDYTTIKAGSGNHTIDTGTAKKISIYGTPNNQGEAIYVGFTVTVKVPAWTQYDLSFPFELQAVKPNAATGTVGRTRVELLNFGRPTDTDPKVYTAANADGDGPITFGKPSSPSYSSNTGYDGAVTTGTNVKSELMVVQNQNTTLNGATTKPKQGTVTVEDTYVNRSDNEATITYSFGFYACNFSKESGTGSKIGMGLESCPSYMLLKSCTAESTNLWLEAPSAVSTTYTGTAYDTSTLTQISGLTGADWYDATKMDVSLQEASAQDVGTYNVDVSLKATGTTDDPWKLSDGTFSHDTQTITLTINKATPTVSFGNASTTTQYTVSGTQDEFPKGTATYNGNTVAGTLSWGGQTPVGSATGNQKSYSYTFTPDDTTNYNSVNGTISLNYVEPGIESVTATFNSGGATVYKSTPTATLNDYFTVKVKYSGIAEPKENKSFTILGWDSGTNVPVTIMVGSSISSPVIIPKIEIDKIQSLSAFITQGSTKVTCNTSKATIKGLLNVLAQWNYAPSTTTLAAADYDIEFTPVVGTNTSTLKVKYTNSDGTVVEATPVGNFTVSPDDFDVSGIKFEDDKVTYDGNKHSIAYSGTLPTGVSVEYEYDGTKQSDAWEFTDAGAYAITLSFTHNNSNYNAIDKTITATLTIDKADVDMSGVKFEDKTEHKDGTAYTLTISGTLPTTPAITVTYSVAGQSGTSFTETGTYNFTAKFTHNDKNYNTIGDKTAKLTISDKPVYDVSGLSFTATGAQGSGTAFNAKYDPDNAVTITLSGKVKDKDGAEIAPTVTYKLQKKVNGAWEDVSELKGAGDYQVIAKISTGDSNYADIDDKTATLTIAKADVDMSGVKFDDLKVAYDGKEHTLTISGTLPTVPTVTVTYVVKDSAELSFTDLGDYEFTAKFTHDDTENYNDIDDKTATLTITDASILGITAKAANDEFTTVNTLDDLKKVLTVTVNTTGGDSVTEDYELSCEGLRDGGKFKFGLQKITVKYTDDDGNEYNTFVEIRVEKEKVALPTFKGGLSYTGVAIKPTVNDFNGYDSALMTFVTDKLQSGLAVGSYKAVFALNDPDNYEWATTTTFKKTVFAAVVYDGETEVVLNANETAVDWNISKAVLTATKTDGALPVFASESYVGAFSDVVTLKYYKDEACTEEVAAEDLKYETQYFVKAELLDTDNFELDASAAAYTVKSFTYTTPAKELTVWDKIVRFLKANWLWLVIAVVSLILLIIIIACAVRASKKKREREEQRRLEEKAERERREEREEQRRREEREERMARMSQQQAMPQMMMPQMMPQMPQPQYMPQQMPQQVQSAPAGGGASSSEIAELKAEILALKTAQESAKEIAELKAENAAMKAEQNAVLRSDVNALRGGEQVIQGGISLDKLTEIIRAEVNNALDGRAKAAVQPAPAAPENGTATQVPPDAVMTTVTTTKIDTTKKPAQNAQAAAPVRTVVRNVVAPMPVDDGRVFDVGGFYKPADPVTDMGFTDEEKE